MISFIYKWVYQSPRCWASRLECCYKSAGIRMIKIVAFSLSVSWFREINPQRLITELLSYQSYCSSITEAIEIAAGDPTLALWPKWDGRDSLVMTGWLIRISLWDRVDWGWHRRCNGCELPCLHFCKASSLHLYARHILGKILVRLAFIYGVCDSRYDFATLPHLQTFL